MTINRVGLLITRKIAFASCMFNYMYFNFTSKSAKSGLASNNQANAN